MPVNLANIEMVKDKDSILVIKFKRKASTMATSDLSFSLLGESFDQFAWWNSTWIKKTEVNVSVPSGTTEQNYTILLNVSYNANMRQDFQDLRFVNGTEDAELPYWVEFVQNSSYADVWVKIDSNITTTNYTIYMYYNNSNALTRSNGNQTFEFFDDFDRANSDSVGGQWFEAESASATMSIQNGNLVLNDTSGASGTSYLRGKNLPPRQNYLIGIRGYYESVNTRTFQFSVNEGGVNEDTGYTLRFGSANAVLVANNPETTANISVAANTTKIYQAKIDNTISKYNFTISGADAGTQLTLTGVQANLDAIQFAAPGSHTSLTRYDWVRFAKYRFPEPTYGFGAEQNYSAITTVNLTYPLENASYSGDEWNSTIEANSTILSGYLYINYTNGTNYATVINTTNLTSSLTIANTFYATINNTGTYQWNTFYTTSDGHFTGAPYWNNFTFSAGNNCYIRLTSNLSAGTFNYTNQNPPCDVVIFLTVESTTAQLNNINNKLNLIEDLLIKILNILNGSWLVNLKL